MQARTFVFKDAKSHKFWSVAVEGDQLVTRWGRVGTDGQEKPKTFADGAEAEAAAEKLIAEKVRKGYVEDGEPGLPEAEVREAAEEAPARVEAEVREEPPSTPTPPAAAPRGDRPSLDLSPAEWSLATWRPLHEAPTGLPDPFDPEAACAQLLAVATGDSWWWHWRRSPIRPLMAPEEAAFWLYASHAQGGKTVRQTAKALAGGPPGIPTRDEAFSLAANSNLQDGETMGALVHLVEPAEIAEWLLQPSRTNARSRLAEGLRAHLLPRLDAADRDRLADGVRARLQHELAADPDYTGGEAAVMAAQLGLHDEVETVCSRWPDGWFGDTWSRGDTVIPFGLGSPDAVRETFERTRLHVSTPAGVAGWLAHTELDGLALVEASVLGADNREEAEIVLEAFASRVHAPEAAPHMAALIAGSRAPAIAKAWMSEHPAEAVRGLAPLLGRQGQRADTAADQLRRLARTGGREELERALEGLDETTAASVRARVLAGEDVPELTDRPAWLEEGVAQFGKGRLPDWLDPEELPPLVADGGRLAAPDVAAVLRALAASGVDEPVAPFVVALREHADSDRADAFAWAVFESWLAAGAPTKGRWALLAVGHLGNDHSATKLAALVRVWPGESQHQRAVLGLSVLQAIGTDTALMLLNGIAQKVKFKGLKQRAREAMDEIAASKGMSREELEDRIVPDCGLDADGRRTFDYGPRSFEFVLGPGMKPMVRDEAGKVRTSPPKPGARDDAQIAARSQEAWKLLRKQVADVAKIQAGRMESAMVTGRRWSAADFRAHLVDHPLQRHLTRLLVLGAWHGDDGPRTFRLTEEGDLADAHDEPFELDDDAEVTVVHPLQLSGEDRAAWGELLADYEIVPPFAQLGRPIYDLEPDELDQRDLTRFAAAKVPAVTLVGILERTGWTRGPAQDAGLFHVHSRAFRHADVTAIVSYDGIPMGYMVDWDDQAIEHCYVVKGTVEPEWGWDYDPSRKNALRWRDVDPIVRSEVLGSLNAVASKAR